MKTTIDDIMLFLEREGLLSSPHDSAKARRTYILIRRSMAKALEDERVSAIYQNNSMAALAHWSSSTPDRTCELVGIITGSNYRGRGYATKLMKTVLNCCSKQSVERIVTYVESDDAIAQSMYEFFGFEKDTRYKRPDSKVVKWQRSVSRPFDKNPEDCVYSKEGGNNVYS